MANGRNPKIRGKDTSRDQGGFVALPWAVLDCPAYATLSHPARSLLLEFARQYCRDNNGRLLASSAYLAKRGWLSAGRIQKAKQELIDSGFIFETVKGHRPNRASWYALTWRSLDRIDGYDLGAYECFERGSYKLSKAKAKRPPPKCKNPKKNNVLIPTVGIVGVAIVPTVGMQSKPVVPTVGAIKPRLRVRSIPVVGNHLEKPSIAVDFEEGIDCSCIDEAVSRREVAA
jgi:hypothetical protein